MKIAFRSGWVTRMGGAVLASHLGPGVLALIYQEEI